MNNPLVGGTPQMSGPMANMQQFMNQFQRFAQSFKGNPQQQVQQMMNDGKVSQERFNWAHQQAIEAQKQMQQFQKMMNGK